MSSVATMSLEFGSDLWNADMYETVGVASHTYATAAQVSTAIYSGIHKVQLAWDLRSLSNKISSFLDRIHASVAKAETTSVAPIDSQQTVSREQLESTIRSLEYIYETTSRLFSTAQKKGLTNNSMMAGSLRTIRRRSEEFLDIADWLKAYLSTTSSELDAIFANARADLAAGEVFGLSEERAVTSHR